MDLDAQGGQKGAEHAARAGGTLVSSIRRSFLWFLAGAIRDCESESESCVSCVRVARADVRNGSRVQESCGSRRPERGEWGSGRQ